MLTVDVMLCTTCKQSDYFETIVAHVHRAMKNGLTLEETVGNQVDVVHRYCNVCGEYKSFEQGQITITPILVQVDPDWRVT